MAFVWVCLFLSLSLEVALGGLAICHSSCAASVQWVICFNEPGAEKEGKQGVLFTFVLGSN